MSDVYSNPDPDERDPAVSGWKAALAGRGAAGTILWFLLLAGAIIALTLVANRCDDDDTAIVETDTTEPTAVPEATEAPAPTATPAPEPTATPAPEPTATPAPEPTPTPEPEALSPTAVIIDVTAGSVTLTGIVPDDETRARLVGAAVELYGAENVADQLQVDDGYSNDNGTVRVTGSAEEATAALLVSGLGAAADGLALDDADLIRIAATDVVAQLNELFSLNPIQFATGSAQILPESLPVLDEVAEILIAAPGLELDIEGHTDSTGDPASNLALSLDRAESVRDYLIGAGVAEGRLVAAGRGDSEPTADNSTEEGRQQNRRIEFAIR